MDITVTFKNGRWVTDPNPAIVAVGTSVRWILRAPEQETRALLWKVSFRHPLPFGDDYEALEVKTELVDRRHRAHLDLELVLRLNLEEDAELNHRGVTEAVSADRTGEFKYDLLVQDAVTEERIGNDDPWLIVVRGVLRPFDLYVF
jgi:hypothetical protein